MKAGKGCLTVIGGFVVLVVIIAVIASAGSNSSSTSSTSGLADAQSQTTTTHAHKAHKPKPLPKPQHFSGSSDENIGTIHVSVPSTLTWSCPSCANWAGSGANFVIGNSFDDANTIDVNELGKSSGKTMLDPGTYTDVEVTTEGEGWTITITPGNSTQG